MTYALAIPLVGQWPLDAFRVGYAGLAKVGNSFDGIRTDTTVIVLLYPTCGESVQPLQS